MGKETNIEWCDSTLNLEMGCNGCELWRGATRTCYAGVLTAKYAGRDGWPKSFEQPSLFPQRLAPALAWSDLTGKARPGKPWLDGAPRLIFLDDMGDTFTEDLDEFWLAKPTYDEHGGPGDRYSALDLMEKSPHQWLMLTKRPHRMVNLSQRRQLPANVWPGTSITSGTARLDHLAAVRGGGPRWASIEPLLGPIDGSKVSWLDWVIVGGESGDKARPCYVQWIEGIIQACKTTAHGYPTPVFVKQLGSCPVADVAQDRWRLKDSKGGDWNEWPAGLRVREIPKFPERAVVDLQKGLFT